MMMMTQQTREKLIEDAKNASFKINELLFQIRERYPDSILTNVNNGAWDSNKIIVKFNVGGIALSATILRSKYGELYHRNFALKVVVNTYMFDDNFKKFNRKFSGSRLKTDILSDKFDVNKIFKALEEIQEFVNEEADRRKLKETRDNKKKNESQEICEYLTENTLHEFENKYGSIYSDDTEVNIITHEQFTLKLNLSKEEMVEMINHLDNFRKNNLQNKF